MVAHRAVVTADLSLRWAELLPGHEQLGADLLRRWSEPHRYYHGTEHLHEALIALATLGSEAATEPLAIWYHDAVHTGLPGTDEQRSAELAAADLSAAGLAEPMVAEVVRLVLVTIDHSPDPADLPGSRVSDSDLAILAADPPRYRRSVAALRAESPGLTDAAWQIARIARLESLLDAPRLFHTPFGRARWEHPARENLLAEHRELIVRASTHAPPRD